MNNTVRFIERTPSKCLTRACRLIIVSWFRGYVSKPTISVSLAHWISRSLATETVGFDNHRIQKQVHQYQFYPDLSYMQNVMKHATSDRLLPDTSDHSKPATIRQLIALLRVFLPKLIYNAMVQLFRCSVKFASKFKLQGKTRRRKCKLVIWLLVTSSWLLAIQLFDGCSKITKRTNENYNGQSSCLSKLFNR
jgi:hypothetical protein